MNATYEKINGAPILRLKVSERELHSGLKTHSVDLPLSAEQARTIEIHIGARP